MAFAKAPQCKLENQDRKMTAIVGLTLADARLVVFQSLS
jgi:hypothetical protein